MFSVVCFSLCVFLAIAQLFNFLHISRKDRQVEQGYEPTQEDKIQYWRLHRFKHLLLSLLILAEACGLLGMVLS